MKVATEKGDIAWLQTNGFIATSQVDIIWEQLTLRCNPIDGGSINYQQSVNDELGELPVVNGKCSKEKQLDFCVAYSIKNGDQLASIVVSELCKRGYKAEKVQQSTSVFDPYEVEKKVASSTSLIVLLTSNCLRHREVVFPLIVAKQYFDHPSLAILVHDASSCLFPGYDEQPEQVKEFFSEKAVTFLSCYVTEGINEIASKYENERIALVNSEKNKKENPEAFLQDLLLKYKDKETIPLEVLREETKAFVDEVKFQEIIASADNDHSGTLDTTELPDVFARLEQKKQKSNDNTEEHEDLTTTLFLSHKRSTGQGIAGRLYEGLKDWYSIFIDSEAKFKIHDLKQIVENTSVFVFILSYGILLSKWCLEEFKSAVANKKKIIVVRELSFSLPDNLPSEWQDYESILRSEDQLLWVAEYNAACVAALKRRAGIRDEAKKELDKFDEKSPVIQHAVQKVKETGELDLTQMKTESPLLALVSADTLIHTIGSVAGFESIKKLKLDGSPSLQQFEYVSLWLPHLVELTVENISDKAIEKLAQRCNSLKIFSITHGSTEFTDAAFIHLGHFSNLEQLELPTTVPLHITDNAIKNLVKGSIRNLKSLNIAGYPFKKTLPLLYQHFPNLEAISVKNWNFTDADMVEPLARFSNLRKIDISGNKGITNNTLVRIGQNFPNLESLDVTECSISGKGMQALGHGCPKIRELRGATEVEEIVLKWPDLEILDGNRLFEPDFDLIKFGNACPKLKVLNAGRTQIDAPAWSQFADTFPHVSTKYSIFIYAPALVEAKNPEHLPPYLRMKESNKYMQEADVVKGPEIGKGNFSAVYKGTFRSSPVAIKYNSQSDLRESQILLCMMPHPNIVMLLDCINVLDTAQPCMLVLEYCENGSLDKYLQTHPNIPAQVLASIARGVAIGLAHIHSEKVVHCDIAARNVALTAGLDPKIIDFGLALYLGDKDQVNGKDNAAAIKWMPPEWFNSVISYKLDVWSFGILLIEILTGGKMPHENMTNDEVSPLIQKEGFHPEIPSNCSKEVKYILEQCFKKDPASRISMKDIVSVLNNVSSLVA